MSTTTPASPKAKAAKKEGGHFQHKNPHSYSKKKKRRRTNSRNFAVPTDEREENKAKEEEAMGLWQRILKLGEERLRQKQREKKEN